MNKPENLIDILDTFYEDDPVVGDVVLIRHNFYNTSIGGEVSGIVRSHANRGYDPEGNYEIIVFHGLKLRFAGIKRWFKIGEDHDWSIVEILKDKEFKKLSADVVLKTKVDEFIEQEERTEDEL